ncbi:MAG: hypothetical protein SNJ74_03460 [Fimbriimonadaceae bacterium]
MRKPVAVWVWMLAVGLAAANNYQVRQVLLADSSFAGWSVTTNAASVEPFEAPDGTGGAAINMARQWSTAWFTPHSPQDWRPYNQFAFRVANVATTTAELVVRIDHTNNFAANADAIYARFYIGPQKSMKVTVDLDPGHARAYGILSLPPAYAEPGLRIALPDVKNLANIYRWGIYQRSSGSRQIRISEVALLSTRPSMAGIVDPFGQSALGTWNGKATTVGDLIADRNAEAAALASNPPMGAENGSFQHPVLPPSNRWRTYRTPSGKWFLVKPNGRLFWSFGLNSVNHGGPSAFQGREVLFQSLPPVGSPHRVQLPMPSGQELAAVDFVSWNLERKYGPSWRAESDQLAVSRLKSWGINTIGSFSDPSIYLDSGIPFIGFFETTGFPRRLQSPLMYGRWMPDVFDPNFRNWVHSNMAAYLAVHNGRENFIGLYTDGELPWGYDGSNESRWVLAFAALNAPPNQPAKLRLVNDLRNKYRTVARFNRAWGTSISHWNDLLPENRFANLRFTSSAVADARLFTRRFAEQYYAVVSSAMKAANCTGLYFGARQHQWVGPDIVPIEAKYADVVSWSNYLPAEEADWNFSFTNKPILIYEFSFAANDSGAWSIWRVPAASQAERAQMMERYVRKALESKKVVGVHWFRYRDQPLTGRADGQSFNFGLVSITDRPYDEMVQAIRNLSANLYSIRGN